MHDGRPKPRQFLAFLLARDCHSDQACVVTLVAPCAYPATMLLTPRIKVGERAIVAGFKTA